MKIIKHIYQNGTLCYEVENSDGTTIIVRAEEIANRQLQNEYWTALNEKHKEDTDKKPKTRFPRSYRKITKIIEAEVINGERYFVCEFEGLDFPVHKVPIGFVKNGHSKLLIDFYEQEFMKNPTAGGGW